MGNKEWIILAGVLVIILLAANVFLPQESGKTSFRKLSAEKKEIQTTLAEGNSQATTQDEAEKPGAASRPSEKAAEKEEQEALLAPPLAYCGNGACEASESCGSCAEDCGCRESEECAGGLVCEAPPSCGGKQCGENELCNEFTKTCATPIPLSASKQAEIVSSYMRTETALDGKPVKYLGEADSYYGDKTAKIISFDCSSMEIYCRLRVVLDEKGNILEEYRTN